MCKQAEQSQKPLRKCENHLQCICIARRRMNSAAYKCGTRIVGSSTCAVKRISMASQNKHAYS